MSMKSITLSLITTVIVLFSLLSTTFAAQPQSCPAVSQIINAGLQYSERDDEEGVYILGQIHNYATPETWAFAIAVPLQEAQTEDQAFSKAREALPTLSGNPAPILYQPNAWMCLYSTAKGYIGAAVTPLPVAHMVRVSKFKN